MNAYLALSLLLVASVVCTVPAADLSVVPQPMFLEKSEGHFALTSKARISAPAGARDEAQYLASILRRSTGYPLDVVDARRNAIVLELDSNLNTGAEGYQLDVTAGGVVIRAATKAGLFYGIQTLRQLLPPEVESTQVVARAAWAIPAVKISDAPRFAWRGAMLDVGRHMLTVDDIKQFIDLMALHKLNTLHWHLTDDQGWRIEIKKYPRLTEVGSVRQESPVHGNRNAGDGKPYGGFFTQAQVKDVVAYATSRHITVVPEIEMPGHAVAALTAYPKLGCTGGPYEVRTRWGVMPDVFCAGNPEVFPFLEDVLAEVLELFPSKIIHLGGDECPKDRWNACPKCQAKMKAEGLKNAHELQSYFVRHFDQWLAAHGRRLIGWDEILEGGLAPGAAVMSWRGVKGGIAAAKSGHDVVMTPTSHLYLDYAQSKAAGEPESIGGFVPLRQVYSFDPVPAGFSPAEAKHVLGAQGNLWAEYLYDFKKVQYFAFPRLSALSEVVWTPQPMRKYDDFLARLPTLLARLGVMGVNFRRLEERPVAATWKSGEVGESWVERSWDVTKQVQKPGTYEVRFQYTSGRERLDIGWVAIGSKGKELARDTHEGVTGAHDKDNVYTLKVTGPVEALVTLNARVRADGGSDSNGDIRIVRKGE